VSSEIQFDGYGAYIDAGGGAKFYPDVTKTRARRHKRGSARVHPAHRPQREHEARQ
jgi:hypothetical protein